MKSHSLQTPSEAEIKDAIRHVVSDPELDISMDGPSFVLNVCRQLGQPYRENTLPRPGEFMYERIIGVARAMPAEVKIGANGNAPNLTPDSDFVTPGPEMLRIIGHNFRPAVPPYR